MSTVGELSAQVKRYLTSNTAITNLLQGQPASATALANEIDAAILIAANNARRFAEMRHDFSDNDVTGRATLSGGAPLDLNNVELDTNYGDEGTFKSFKTVTACYQRDEDSGLLTPMKIYRRKTAMVRTLMNSDLSVGSSYEPDINETPQQSSIIHATINGRKLFVHPSSASSVYPIAIDGNVWMDDYTTDDDTDFILVRGFAYMQWATICELNAFLLKYVPRQEGTISPPTDARDLALDALIANDAYSIEGNIYYDF